VIFTTVGSQEPFDRLIKAVDEWAAARSRTDVFAQLAGSKYRPQHIEFTDFMDPAEYDRRLRGARIIVAHAGMGSIISALELGKPIVVMPRRADLRETRNDHQVAAVRRFNMAGRVIVAQDELDLPEKLDYALTLAESDGIGKQASPQLIATIKTFLQESCAQPVSDTDSALTSESKPKDGHTRQSQRASLLTRLFSNWIS
jgi:UDP-N-acetylglucosamine transferase subunit ALG13